MGKIIKISKSMNITARNRLVLNATEGVIIQSSYQIQLNAGEKILYQSSDDIEFQPPHTTRVYLGVFFDGTGNNKYNVEARKKGHIPIEKSKDRNYSSYFVNYSNIARLWNLYKKGYDQNEQGTRKTYYTRAYIEGIGTKRGEPDDMIGTGMGRLERGILGKVEDAYQEVIREFKKDKIPSGKKKNYLGQEVPHIDELVIDIFGFSRGAAAARHFANVVNTAFEPEKEEKYWSISQKDFAYRKIERQPPGGDFGRALEKAGFPLGDTVIKIRFIGLFDTVAAVTSNLEMASPVIGAMGGYIVRNIPGAVIGGILGAENISKAAQNCDNGDIQLSLANVQAEKKLHLTAADEYRANFVLNKENTAHEMQICGVHSDIGGGYGEVTEENDYILSLTIKTSDKTPPKELEELKKKFEESEFYQEKQIWIETTKHEELDRSPRNLESMTPRMNTTYHHTLKGSRGRITDRYSLIPMEIMKEYAQKSGVKWMSPAEAENKDMNNIPQTDYKYNDDFLEKKILPIYKNHYLNNKKQSFEYSDYKTLYNEYLHISSEYNTPIMKGMIYPNQPNETGKRKICN